MKKLFFTFSILLFVCVVVSSCGKKENDVTTVAPVTTTQEITTEPTTETTTAATTTATETTSEAKSKMLCSSSPSNPYLNAVVKKYGVDPSLLVAYYSEDSTSNGNIVLEFDGSTDANGKPVRTYNTMTNMYAVDADYSCRKATGTKAQGNEYSTAETYVFKLFAKKVIFEYFGNEIQNA